MKKIVVFASLMLATCAAQCMKPYDLDLERARLNNLLMMSIISVVDKNKEKEKELYIQELLRQGAEVDTIGTGSLVKDYTPLGKASSFDLLNIARILIENHADVNALDNFGETALMHAVKHNNQNIVEYLLSITGIDVNMIDALTQETALDMAYEKKNKTIIDMLEAAGAKTYKELEESEQKS